MACLLALCAVALWSSNAAIGSFALQSLAVEQVQLLQFLGATLVLTLLQFSKRRFPKHKPIDKVAWMLGVIGLTGTMILQYTAFSIGPIFEVNVLAYAWPLFAAILFVLMGNTRRPVSLLIKAAAGFVGAGLVIGGDNLLFGTGFSMSTSGFFASIGSAVCMAVFSVGIANTRTPANAVLLPGSIVGLIITALWCIVGSHSWDFTLAIVAGVYLGVGPMGMGYLFWSWAMQKDVTGRTALIGFVTPVTSTALLLLDGQQLDTMSLIGAALVIICCTTIGFQSRHEANS